METKRALGMLASFVPWLESLKQLSEETWHEPIGEDKWSTAEIVAHIMFWDRFVAEQALVQIRNGEPVTFPEVQRVNDEAAVYAMNDAEKDELVDQAVQAREALIAAYQSFPGEDFDKNFSIISGHLRRSNYYNLLYMIDEFIQHDHHHKRQIVEFLQSVKQR